MEIDYPAVMGSRGRLWRRYGEAWAWPPATMTVEQDREDLERHERESEAQEAFNYAILDADESTLIGCVYIDPPAPDDRDHDAVVSWWVVDDHADSAVGAEIASFVPNWVTSAWPFSAPRYGP